MATYPGLLAGRQSDVDNVSTGGRVIRIFVFPRWRDIHSIWASTTKGACLAVFPVTTVCSCEPLPASVDVVLNS